VDASCELRDNLKLAIFLIQGAWKMLLPPLADLTPWTDSCASVGSDVEVPPRRKRYADLLAVTMSDFACLNCQKKKINLSNSWPQLNLERETLYQINKLLILINLIIIKNKNK